LDLDAKMKYKITAIEKRKEIREENISKLRTNEEARGTERINDKVVEFYGTLDPMIAEVRDRMDKAKTMDKALVPAHLDETMRKMKEAYKFMTDYTMYIPAYDTKAAQKTIADVHEEFQTLQTQVLPKKKFGFKGNRQKVNTSKVEDKLGKIDLTASSNPFILDTSIRIGDKTDELIVLEANQINAADVNLTNLENCRVHVDGSPSTVHLSNIRNCRILTGPVSSSIFMENCSNSKLVLSSQQLRIHNTKDSDFYIHVTAKAVIEDCDNLRFGVNPLLGEIREELWTLSRLDRVVNNWDQVGDFNWLAKDKASPHWSKLESADCDVTSVAEFLAA